MGTEPAPRLFDKGLEDLYESGKHRRYTLLFALNGGGYTLAVLLVNLLPRMVFPLPALLVLALLSAAMACLSYMMCEDIHGFGEKMREWDLELRSGENPVLTGESKIYKKEKGEALVHYL